MHSVATQTESDLSVDERHFLCMRLDRAEQQRLAALHEARRLKAILQNAGISLGEEGLGSIPSASKDVDVGDGRFDALPPLPGATGRRLR